MRNREIVFESALEGLDANAAYTLHARVTHAGEDVHQFTSPVFQASELRDGRYAFSEQWLPDRLWDIHTPQNMYEVTLSLRRADGTLHDATFRERFGFREFWIEGKDFYLNGTRLFLSVVPFDNAQVGAALASYEGATELFFG